MAEHKLLSAEEMLEKIFGYMNMLADEKDFASTIHVLTEMGRTIVNADRASFWVWDRRNKQHFTIVALDNGMITVPEGKGIVGASIMKNETILINDTSRDYRFHGDVDKDTGYVTKSILCMPVTDSSGAVIGAYQAINKLDGNGMYGAFSETDKKRLALAAIYCGKMLESHLLYNESQMDPVTKLRNRKGFYDYYNKRILPYLYTEKVAVVMGDIDFFSVVNRIHGKSGGDVVMKEIADLIVYKLRLDDEAIRWENDRFLILLPGKDTAAAVVFAEELRSSVEAARFAYGEYELHVTMSFGVSELAFKNSSDENIELVESKLKQAKDLGRNRVES